DSLIAWALPNQAALFVEFVDKSNHIDLYVGFAQPRKKLVRRIEARSVLAVCNYNQSATSSVTVVTFFIFSDMIGGKENRVDYCRLTTFNIETIKAINQQ